MIPDIDTRMLDVAQRYGRYKPNAYRFIYEAVRYTVEERYEATLEVRHVTGREVLEGIRDLARRKFGFMAKTVFEQWGVLETEDFGTIVFQLVSEGILSKTDTDTMSDFEHGYDFEETFVRNFDWLEQFADRRSEGH